MLRRGADVRARRKPANRTLFEDFLQLHTYTVPSLRYFPIYLRSRKGRMFFHGFSFRSCLDLSLEVHTL